MATPLPPSETPFIVREDQQGIKNAVQAYFDAEYLAYHSFQLDDLIATLSTAPDAKDFWHIQTRTVAWQSKYYRLNELRYDHYDYQLNFNNIVFDAASQTATVSLAQGHKVIYEISELLEPQNPIVSGMANVKHTIILRNEQEAWKVISDVYDLDDGRLGGWPLPGKSADDILGNLDKGLKNTTIIPLDTKKATPTPIPAKADQIERWKEYQSALAGKLLPQSAVDDVLCEWQILGQAQQDIYVWAVCSETQPMLEISQYFFRTASVPAVIHLGADNAIQSVEIPAYGSTYLDDLRKLFPLDVQKNRPDLGALEAHLDLRRTSPEKAPLIVPAQ